MEWIFPQNVVIIFIPTSEEDMTLASIVHCNVKGTIYLYESTGYRDKIDGGKVKNARKLIGKIDKVTGEPIYKPMSTT
jgi:hypothetical protein